MPPPTDFTEVLRRWQSIPPGGATYAQLAQIWEMDGSNVHRFVERMERRGLLVYEEQRRVNGRRQDVIFRFEMGREL